MPRRHRPGPKSVTQSKIISGSFGEVSSSDDDSSPERSSVGNATRELRSDRAKKSQRKPDQSQFRSPDTDRNVTDYELEFTTSRMRNQSPPRCSTFRTTATQAEQLNTRKTKETNQQKTKTKPGATQSKKKETQKAQEATTRPNVITPETAVRRPRKQHSPKQLERRFWKEVQALQTRQFLIARLPFARLVREIILGTSTEVTQITKIALEGLQTSTEHYITQRLQDAYMLTLHRGRVTLDAKDMQLINTLKGIV